MNDSPSLPPPRSTRYARLAVAALAATLAACSTAEETPGEKACEKLIDCPSGQVCREKKCVTLPCSGSCTSDEVCIDDACKPADGLSCANDPSLCPAEFTCAPVGKCRRHCELDEECRVAAGTPVCNPELGYCAECVFPSDCKTAGKTFCDATSGSCVGCVTGADCRVNGAAIGQYCEATTQACKTGCRDSANCPSGQRCLGGTANEVGRCIECTPTTAGNDCLSSPKLYCQPVSNLCVECLKNADCTSDQCDLTKNKCVACLKNEKCGHGYICDQDLLDCVPGCAGGSGGSNCPDGSSGTPRLPACEANRGDRGTCVACLVDADCPRAQVCKPGSATVLPQCVPGCTNLSGAEVPARCAKEPGTMPVDLLCDASKGPRGKCVECKAKVDCSDPNEPSCDEATGLCRCAIQGEACTASAACGSQEVIGSAVVTKCNAALPGSAWCITKVDCSSVSCNLGEKTVTRQCAVGSRGGARCSGIQGNCPAGTKPDWGFAVEDALLAPDKQSKLMCIPENIDCK